MEKRRANRPALLLALLEFYAPVSVVEELLPARVPPLVQLEADDRVSARPLGNGDQRHMGLRRRAPALLDVALQARAHNIVPRALPALAARHNVVQRQLGR